MSEVTVQVHVSAGDRDVHAGTLCSHRRGRVESATFAYTQEYLTLPGAYELDPALPLSTAPSQTPVGHKLGTR